MKLIFASLLIVAAASAHATPAPEILDLLEKSYDSQITFAEKDITPTLEVCNQTKVVITGKDPVDGSQRDATLTLYVRKFTQDGGDLPTILLMPPTGGENVLDRNYARVFCASGFRVALLQSWKNDTLTELDMNMHDRGALRAVAAMRHALDYLKPRRASQIGIFGTSVGAISSALALGIESRLAAGIFIVGGGGMSEIISSSTEQTLTRLRNERMKAFGLSTIAEYERALAQHIKIDPMDFVGFTGAKPVLTMIATADDTVPTKNQQDLYHAYGDQQLLTYDDNHRNTIIYTAATKGVEFVRFFSKHLK